MLPLNILIFRPFKILLWGFPTKPKFYLLCLFLNCQHLVDWLSTRVISRIFLNKSVSQSTLDLNHPFIRMSLKLPWVCKCLAPKHLLTSFPTNHILISLITNSFCPSFITCSPQSWEQHNLSWPKGLLPSYSWKNERWKIVPLFFFSQMSLWNVWLLYFKFNSLII